MEKTIEDLKLEADELGITYVKNIGAAKLQAKIDEFYEADSKSADIATTKDEEDDIAEELTSKSTVAKNKMDAIRIIKEQERVNAESVIVKLTMVDRREASTATDAYFGNGNYGMKVPLDTWVEMPRILVNMAEEAKAIIHKEIDGKSVSSMVKKYVVEYKK